MSIIAILAGDYKEFREYAIERERKEGRPIPEMRYVSRAHTIMRSNVKEVTVIGTFWDRKDANSIYAETAFRLHRHKSFTFTEEE
jgi:hypothetical protein